MIKRVKFQEFLLREMTYIETPDGTLFDVETEKIKTKNQLIRFFDQIFSGKTLYDKYGNKNLKTKKM